MLTVCVDFDHTLYRPSAGDTLERLSGSPMPGALEFVRALVDMGIRVVILSVRGSNYEGSVAAIDWLEAHGFPRLELTSVKPAAAMYLDDKAWRFDGSFEAPLAELVRLQNEEAAQQTIH